MYPGLEYMTQFPYKERFEASMRYILRDINDKDLSDSVKYMFRQIDVFYPAKSAGAGAEISAYWHLLGELITQRLRGSLDNDVFQTIFGYARAYASAQKKFDIRLPATEEEFMAYYTR
jgi:hypothetical protein